MINRAEKSPRKSVCFLFFLSAILLSSASLAGFVTDRVRLNLSFDNPIEALQISASKGAIALIQTSTVRWTQKNGENVYDPTKDLIVSPPFMRIPPASTQILRVGLRSPNKPAEEIAYRIYIQEVTPHSSKPGIEFRLRESIPIFLAPANPVIKATLGVKRMARPGQLALVIKNEGNIHLQLIHLQITDEHNKTQSLTGKAAYALAGQTISLTFEAGPLTGSRFQLVAKMDSGDIAQTVSLTS